MALHQHNVLQCLFLAAVVLTAQETLNPDSMDGIKIMKNKNLHEVNFVQTIHLE